MFVLKTDTIFVPAEEGLDHQNVLEILRKIEARDYTLSSKFDELVPVDLIERINIMSIERITRKQQGEDSIYEVTTREGKHRGREFQFTWKDNRLWLIRIMAWIA